MPAGMKSGLEQSASKSAFLSVVLRGAFNDGLAAGMCSPWEGW